MATPARRSRRARIALVGGVFAALLAAGGAFAFDAYGALEDSRDDLAAVRKERRRANRHLDATRQDVDATTYGRDVLRAQLRDLERQIRLARGDLGTTRRRSAARSARIPVLTECFNGVAAALNAAAVGDERTAIFAALAVEPICARARGRNG